MMKKLFTFLSSTRLMAVLFIIFPIALGLGTFIENEYNTDTARILIYNTKWFELIMLIFVINFIGNIKKYQLYKKEKWVTLVLHLSFIFILVGAFVTRYISYEGMMPIRETEKSNQIFSDRTFLTVMTDGMVDGEMKRRTFENQHLFSGALDKDNFISNFASNYFSMKKDFNGIPFKVEFKDFIMGATEQIQPDENGIFFLKMVESGDGTRHEHFLKEGEVQNFHNVLFAFNKPTPGAINITKDGDNYTIETPFEGNFMRMADQFQGKVDKDQVQELMFRSLYNIGGSQFVFPELPMKGKIGYVSDNNFKTSTTHDALMLTVSTQDKDGNEVTEDVTLLGSKGTMGVPQSFKLGELEFTLMFGSKIYTTPFEVQLNDFIANKYPGTEKSYSSFESKVTVLDPRDKNFDAHIYMNNVLDYDGYRFFQAQFDPDEKGTILSVSHDFYGTWITYIGYTLLYISMLLLLVTKNTRFDDLRNKLNKVRAKKKSLITALLLFISLGAFAQHNHKMPSEKQLDSILEISKVPLEHADKFGKLIIQDAGGRMKPINTFSSELLRKVSKSDHYKGMDSDQVLLSITQFPQLWYNVPIINLKKENDSIREVIGIPADQKFAALINFFDEQGNYKLDKYLEEANHTTVKNQFQKDFIEADKKVNLLYSAITGQILNIFPVPYDKGNKWINYLELNESDIKGEDLQFTKIILPAYLTTLMKSLETKDYTKADEFLQNISDYQHKFGAEVMPSDQHVEAEILYNKYDIFKRLYSWYMYASVLLFAVVIIRIFKDNKILKLISNIFIGFVIVLFLLHTAGLAARWYVSGHAPWSDAYESMIYVGWATMLFGLIFGRKSELTIASTAFVAGMILMIAHWSWMDPAIANLQPVLNSYWLMIHVAVIVASYGPFALGMILGIVALFLMVFTTKNNKAKMDLNVKEITYINEMALTVGLVLLTIGNFLGGQWANESWGRYWGWDPKETWALVSIMVYAFVIHMRFVPSLRGTWIYNFMSIIAFYAILMTYFGVNFYLSGLHSYAKGDQVVTPAFIWWSVGSVFTLGALAYYKYRIHYKK
ncbi:cytochrome c biogenesis protein CcsA [Flavobacterium sp. I3-2]|uniref:cytochrome c biogenesis protein CcsA n=1 Tax=Flavobacterium sp. I3-2 TaxID=2748319 RepID=UPI0015AE2452|nr:cytochrome c biogenesis protein CcsA [Flavobacterium sp. I3-2]